MKPVRFLSPAEQEMVEAAAFYEMQAPGLGTAFLATIEAAVHDIAKNPERWPLRQFSIRRRLIDRFPYALLYRVEVEGLLIVAVAHLRRQPGYWGKRLT